MEKEKKSVRSDLIAKDIPERLQEIEKQTQLLHQERAYLLKERLWYRRPANLISIFAIAVTITLFILNISISERQKEITTSYTSATSLMAFEPSAKARIKLLYEDKPLIELWRFLVRFAG